jgi:hypothetical protein
MLVPDLDELERQDADRFAVRGVKRDRTLVVEIGIGDPEAVQLGADDLDATDAGEGLAQERTSSTQSLASRT